MTLALTRAGTIGPVAEAVRAAGGSVARIFRAADLPTELLERPDALILLRDQFQLVETAARSIGDDALPARLSRAAGLDGLGPYGRHVTAFPDLGTAISEGYRSYARLLQASTDMRLFVRAGMAVWTYRITAPLTVGRQKNEVLAIGYMLHILRWFLGGAWEPDHVVLPGTLAGRSTVEDLFACPIRLGEPAAVVFPSDLLDVPAPRPARGGERDADRVPCASETAAVVRHMIALERLAGTYGITPVAARMGTTVRTLQRHLAAKGTTFAAVSREADEAQARALLRRDDLSVTEIAHRLGYSDPAHFSRAFRRWTGTRPSRWRTMS